MCEYCDQVDLSKYECIDCGVNTSEINEIYYLDIEEVKNIEGHLCIDCMEKHLGRQLTENDFSYCQENMYWPNSKSEKLLNRLGNRNIGLLSDKLIQYIHENDNRKLGNLMIECKWEIIDILKAFGA